MFVGDYKKRRVVGGRFRISEAKKMRTIVGERLKDKESLLQS